jgi:hypothetical protein
MATVLLYLVAVALLSCVFLALIWGIVFVGSQSWLLVGEAVSPRQRRNNRAAWGFNYRENNSAAAEDTLRDPAQAYLLRVVALTNATEVDDGYLLNVGANTFHVRDRYVRRLGGAKDNKSRYEQTCFFVPNQGMPSAEQIATVLLMLKHDPTLFDKWAVRDGVSFKADGQIFD